MGKIKTAEEIVKIVKALKKQGKKIVTTNGMFDILHKGHCAYLAEAKSLGDILVVAINTDETVKKLKGQNRPINNQHDRAEVLAALQSVDYITFFSEDDPRAILSKIKPHIHVKGGDYEKDIIEKATVEANGGEVKILSLTKGISTTSIINKIKQQ